MSNLAILNSLLVNSASRFLGKIYAQDLEVSGTTSFTSISATERSTFSGGITVGNYNNTAYALSTSSLIINEWVRIIGNHGWYNQTYGGGMYMTDANYVKNYAGKSLLLVSNNGANPAAPPQTGLYLGSTGNYYFRQDGSLSANQLLATVATINNATISGDLIVDGLLTTNEMEAHVRRILGGSALVCPTFMATDNTTIICTAVTASTVSFTITDSQAITSLTYGGANWNNGSKLKFTGAITANNITTNPPVISFVSSEAVLTSNMNATSGKLTFTVDYTNANTYFKVSSTNLTYEDMSVMMYKIKSGNNYFPVGIYIKSYGEDNKNSYIDVYGGTTTTPNARLGLLNGLKDPDNPNADLTINGSTVTGWGLMTSYGYFKGKIVSTSGEIGGWSIANTSLSNGTLGQNGSMWLTTADVNTAVKFAGAPSAIATWRIGAGSKFGVTSDGTVYASNIQASGGAIGNFTINNGKLYSNNHSAYNTAVAGVYIGDDYISFGSGGVTYFKNDGTGKIGPWTLTATSFYKGNATVGTAGNSNIYLGDNGLSLSDKFVYKTSDGTLSLNVSSLKISGADVMTASAVQTAINQSAATVTELIEGTQTVATSRWTGTSEYLSALVDGVQIRYWIPYAVGTDWLSYTPTNGIVASGVGLTLTLSNGTTTTCIPCFRDGITRLRGQYGAGNKIILTYRENVTINGQTVAKGWWVDASHDSTRYTGNITTGTAAIVAGNIIVGKDGVYKHLKSGSVFSVSEPILYATANIAANTTDSTGLAGFIAGIFGVGTTQNITLTANKAIYIKGTLSGTNFTPASTAPLTQTVPTAYDGYQYIYLGTAYNTTEMNLEQRHTIYMYFGTKFMPMSQISKNYMYFDATNGLVLSQNEVSASTDLQSAGGNIRLTGTGMGVFQNNTKLAEYGSTITINHGTSGKKALTLDSTYGLQFFKLDDSTKAAQLNADGLTVSIGKIGNWVINSTGMYYGSATPGSTSVTLIPSGTTAATISIGGSSGSKSWVFTAKNLFGVDTSGNMYCSGGQIAGWTISTYRLYQTNNGKTTGIQAPGSGSISFVAGSEDASNWGNAPFMVTHDGELTATNATISGTIYADLGTIGGWTIDSSRIYKDVPAASSSSGKHFYIGMRSNPYDSTQSEPHNLVFWVQHDDLFKFYVRSNGYMSASDANIAGTIYANAGTIGGENGWTITTNKITSGTLGSNNSFHMGTQNLGTATIAGNSLSSWRLTIGSKFGVTGSGALYATDATISGTISSSLGEIGGWTIDNSRIYKDVPAASSSSGKHFYIGMRSNPYDSSQSEPHNLVFWVQHDDLYKFYVRSNGYLSASDANIAGTIYANTGRIGGTDGWTISTNKITNGTLGQDNSFHMGTENLGTATIAQNRLSSWRLTVGSKFGVTGSGALYAMNATISGNVTASTGEIGGWTIESTYLKYGTPGMANGALLSPGGYAISTQTSGTISSNYFNYINTLYTGGTGTVESYNWAFTVGNNFGVKKDGGIYSNALYCNGGAIGGWRINSSGIHCNHNSSNVSTVTTYSGLSTGYSTNAIGENVANYAFYAGETNKKYGEYGSDAKLFITQNGELISRAENDTTSLWLYHGGLGVTDEQDYMISSGLHEFGVEISKITSNNSIEYSASYHYDHMDIIGPNHSVSMYATSGNISTSGAFQISNDYRYVGFLANNQSNAGIYDYAHSSWIIRSDSSQHVYIPHITYIAGNVTLQSKNHGYYLTNDSSTYPAIYENGSNLWIGSTATDGTHHIGATFISAGYDSTNSTGNATIYISVPNANNNGGTNYRVLHTGNYSSDIRLKENINDTEVKSAMSLLNAIKVRSFDWKDKDEHQKIGFIADEIEKLDPKLAEGGGYDSDGGINVKWINTFYMQGYIVKAMQEEDSKVTALEKQVSELEQENQELRQRIIRLEATIL